MENTVPQKKNKRCPRLKSLCLFSLGIIFAVGAFLGINFAMSKVSAAEYCGSACHEMKEPYNTWELSPHGLNRLGVRVECADCHLPSKDNYFHYTFAKAYTGIKDMAVHYFGPEYDAEKIRKKVRDNFSNEPCLRCHQDLLVSPTSFDAMGAHQGLIDRPDAPENQCIHCHPNVGHERDSKLHKP
jgi:formylglycine-generating enzyme